MLIADFCPINIKRSNLLLQKESIMKHHTQHCLLLLFVLLSCTLNAQTLDWVSKNGSSAGEIGNCINIDGIPIEVQESNEKLAFKVKEIMTDLKVPLEEFDKSHRIGPVKDGK